MNVIQIDNEREEALERAMSIVAAILAAAPEGALVAPDVCEHRLRVAQNNDTAVCVLCRTVLPGPCHWAVCVQGPEIPLTPPPALDEISTTQWADATYYVHTPSPAAELHDIVELHFSQQKNKLTDPIREGVPHPDKLL